MVLFGLAVSSTGARSTVTPNELIADPWFAITAFTWAVLHWAAIWRADGSAPMTLERRAIGPPSSSVDIQGTTCPAAVASFTSPAMPDLIDGPEPAGGWP